jgi:hypothetical protein
MSTPSGRTSILIALIGLSGVLGAAIISRPVSQVADTQRSIISGQDSGNNSLRAPRKIKMTVDYGMISAIIS